MDLAQDIGTSKYLILYVALVIPLALSFIFMRRGSKAPVQLRLKDQDQNRREPPPKASAPQLEPGASEAAKSLNAVFNWNGHSWDAYEVFGLPAGSSIEVVQAAYDKAVLETDEESRHFFHAALVAILKP